jgi:hypothetical protein
MTRTSVHSKGRAALSSARHTAPLNSMIAPAINARRGEDTDAIPSAVLHLARLAFAFCVALLLIHVGHAADPGPAKMISIAKIKHSGPVDFEKEVLPILKQSCLACHNQTKPKGGLVLDFGDAANNSQRGRRWARHCAEEAGRKFAAQSGLAPGS